MAGDWIKMRTDLADDPAVIRLAAQLDLSEDDVVGKLHRLWSWADRHTVDGVAQGISERWVDRYVGKSGFADLMRQVGWLVLTEEAICFPNFDRHNGASAKKRGEATIRQRLSREQRDNGVTGETRDLIPRPFARVVMERDDYRCVYCGTQSSEPREQSHKKILSIDHIIPATRGGQTAVPNLVCSCQLCNKEKNDRTPEEWGILPTFLAEAVTYQSQQICDRRVTREEKRREEGKKKKKQATGCPESFPITPQMQAWAAKKVPGLDVVSETEQFLDHHRARESVWSDWTAAWRTWMRNAVKFANERQEKAGSNAKRNNNSGANPNRTNEGYPDPQSYRGADVKSIGDLPKH